MKLNEQQQAYWDKLVEDLGINEDEDLDTPEPRRHAIVYMDESEGNGPFVQTFDTREELIDYDRRGTVYDDTKTRDEKWTKWVVFQVHDLELMQCHWFRHVLDIGPASHGEDQPPTWPTPSGRAIDIIKEFVADVEVVGRENVVSEISLDGNDYGWPDLVETYDKAKALLGGV